MWKNLRTLVPDISNTIKAGQRLAKIKGKSGIWGTFKGLTKGVGKKVPFIFAALMLASEIPNIVKATKEKGLLQGIKETIKPVVRLVGAGIGSVIGTAVLPFGGSIAGWIAGEWLAGKIVGKSYSEKEAEKQEQEQETIAKLQQQGILPQNPTAGAQTTPTQNIPQQQNPFAQPTNGMTQPFGPMYPTSALPYSDDIMMQKMPFNTVA
jgi:hypothetical protein